MWRRQSPFVTVPDAAGRKLMMATTTAVLDKLHGSRADAAATQYHRSVYKRARSSISTRGCRPNPVFYRIAASMNDSYGFFSATPCTVLLF